MKTPKFGKIFTLLIAASTALIATAHPQAARTVMVNSNSGVLLFPTNLWSANAANARSGLSLGSAATNPASAFQPSSTILSNLANSNGAGLTNLTATNVTGTVALASNVTGTIAISNGGTGATNAAMARTNLGLGAANSVAFSSAVFGDGISLNYNEIGWEGGVLFDLETEQINGTWNFVSAVSFGDVATTRTNLGLGTSDTVRFGAIWLQQDGEVSNNISHWSDGIQFRTAGFTYFETDLAGSGSINFYKPLYFPTNTNSASITRTNLSLGAAWLTNTNVTNFRSDIGLGSAATNLASAFQPSSSVLSNLANNNGASLTNINVSNLGTISVVNGGTGATNAATARTNLGLGMTNNVFFSEVQAFSFLVGDETNSAIYFEGDSAARTRTNLGLGWPALTNTNSGTGLVSVNTNGTVVSPTNFWDVAPIQTLVQNFTPVANATNAATNARTLYAYSLAISTVGVTNVITLPTNTATKNGDEVTVIHMGPTSSITAIRQLGQTNNLITINKTDESVKFIYENNAWTNFHNISFVEPIQFSGTNAVANAAASRTNLGLGNSSSPEFASLLLSDLSNTNAVDYAVFVDDTGSFYSTSGGAARTNLGLPLAALTNTSVTNFQKAIFYTNTAPSNIGGNLGSIAAWIEIVASNGVTYKVPAYTNIP